MPRNANIDTILNSGTIITASRVLTTEIDWPAGEPPYVGDYVNIPVISSVIVYDVDTFVSTNWTDCSQVINNWTFDQNITNILDSLTLEVGENWTKKDVDSLFKIMRVIVVQEKYTNGVTTTDWINVAYCISTGYKSTFDFDKGLQRITVTGLSTLMLAKLNIIGDVSGVGVYQPDFIKYGSFTTHFKVNLTAITSDAYEFGIPERGGGTITAITSGYLHDTAKVFTAVDVGSILTIVESTGNLEFEIITLINATTVELDAALITHLNSYYFIGEIQPNWADLPAPRFWAEDVPNAPAAVPLQQTGDAVQAVFGEGIIRISQNYCAATPGTPKDYTQGLGYAANISPLIKGIINRFVHDDLPDFGLSSDIVAGLTVDRNSTGYLCISSLTALENKNPTLRVILEDGSNRFYKATTIEVIADGTKITITDATATFTTGQKFTYGYANTAEQVTKLMLFECGFHQTASTQALYIKPIEAPLIGSDEVLVLVPPLTYKDTDERTRLEALEELRSNYAVPPQWLMFTNSDGQIEVKNIKQLFDSIAGGNVNVIPINVYQSPDIDRTDTNIYSKVVVYGQARQVEDFTQDKIGDTFTTIFEDDASAEALPAAPVGVYGEMVRSGGSGEDKVFDLYKCFDRGQVATLRGYNKRPWGWYFFIDANDYEDWIDYKTSWVGALLGNITFTTKISIESLELDLSNPWWYDTQDWGGALHKSTIKGIVGPDIPAWANPQSIDIEYYNYDLCSWETLCADVIGNTESVMYTTINSNDFTTRKPVYTDKIRIRCIEPFTAASGYTFSYTGVKFYYVYLVLGIYLSQIKVYSSAQIRGEAELGVTVPFNTDKWVAVKDRIRTRTHIVDSVADWATNTTLANNLAKEWLYTVTRNLSPRSITTIRPDVIIGDTVRLILPTGEVNNYATNSVIQLNKIQLYILDLNDTDDGVLYYTLTKVSTTITLNIYSDAAKTELVSSGSRTNDGLIELTGLIYGNVIVAHTIDDEGVLCVPTYLVTGVSKSFNAPCKLTLVNYIDPFFED